MKRHFSGPLNILHDSKGRAPPKPPNPISHVCSLTGKYISRKHFTYRPVQIFKIMFRRFYSPESDPPHKITQPHPTTRWLDYKSTHTMVPSHSWFFLFYHYTFQGFCLRTLIQPLVETTGLLNSWVFPHFYHEPYQPQRIDKGGSPSRVPPWAKSLILTVPGLGLSPQRHAYGSESVPIVQGLVYDLNVYKTHW